MLSHNLGDANMYQASLLRPGQTPTYINIPGIATPRRPSLTDTVLWTIRILSRPGRRLMVPVRHGLSRQEPGAEH